MGRARLRRSDEEKFRGICRGLIEANSSAPIRPRRFQKFRGICRGLIEAESITTRNESDARENSAASAAASLKPAGSRIWRPRSSPKFRGICRGLIEAKAADW